MRFWVVGYLKKVQNIELTFLEIYDCLNLGVKKEIMSEDWRNFLNRCWRLQSESEWHSPAREEFVILHYCATNAQMDTGRRIAGYETESHWQPSDVTAILRSLPNLTTQNLVHRRSVRRLNFLSISQCSLTWQRPSRQERFTGNPSQRLITVYKILNCTYKRVVNWNHFFKSQ